MQRARTDFWDELIGAWKLAINSQGGATRVTLADNSDLYHLGASGFMPVSLFALDRARAERGARVSRVEPERLPQSVLEFTTSTQLIALRQ